MKKYICECSGCNHTATVKLRNGHRICEDCQKKFRRRNRAGNGRKIIGFYKEVLIGHLGEFNIYTDVRVKL